MYRAFLPTVVMVICACDLLPRGLCQQAGASRNTATTSLSTIGIYTGSSPFQLSPPADVKNPILRGADVNDLKVDTLAHPFMLIEGSHYYLFFTAKDHKTDKSGIGLAESTNGFDWEYKRIVVHGEYTLAHPFVFKWHEEYYMIPEAHTEKFVRLYRATQKPKQRTR